MDLSQKGLSRRVMETGSETESALIFDSQLLGLSLPNRIIYFKW